MFYLPPRFVTCCLVTIFYLVVFFIPLPFRGYIGFGAPLAWGLWKMLHSILRLIEQEYWLFYFKPVDMHITEFETDQKTIDVFWGPINHTNETREVYTASASYSFDALGSIYKGSRVFPFIRYFSDRSMLLSATGHVRPGRTVTGYFNPRVPEQNYLVRIRDFGPYKHFFIGLAAALFCWVMLVAIIQNNPSV